MGVSLRLRGQFTALGAVGTSVDDREYGGNTMNLPKLLNVGMLGPALLLMLRSYAYY